MSWYNNVNVSRHALEGVSYGAMLTPLLMGHGFRKERAGLGGGEGRGPIQAFPRLDELVDEDDSEHLTALAIEGDHTPNHAPSSPPPPTPLLRNHLHAAKLRHSKAQTENSSPSDYVLPLATIEPCNLLVSTSGDPLPSKPDHPVVVSDTSTRHNLSVQSQDSSILHWSREKGVESGNPSSPAHLLRSSTPVSGSRDEEECCDGVEDVFGALVGREGAVDSPNLLDKIRSEMVRRHRSKPPAATSSGLLTVHSHDITSGLLTVQPPASPRLLSVHSQRAGTLPLEEKQASTTPVGEISISRKRGCQSSHYSATLGMDFGDLPRRKLRGVARGCDDDSEGVPPLAHPSSPSLHSASLGITLPRGEGRRGRRKRGREGGADPHKENLQESLDLTMTPPPILKILESNAKRRHIPKHLPPISTSGVSEGQNSENLERRTISRPLFPLSGPPAEGNPPGGPPTGGKAPGPLNGPPTEGNPPDPMQCPMGVKATSVIVKHPSSGTTHRFKSPWRWASLGGRLSYTPIKDKGSVSK